MRLSNKVCGYYKLEAIKVKDGKEISKRVVADWFPNLITNNGLDRMAASDDILLYCMVGSGNTAPAFTDSTLVTRIASVTLDSQTTGTQTTSPYYCWWRTIYRFATGTAAGNLAEVGVGWTTTAVMSRALILDSEGDPTVVTILSDEILDVVYEYRIYPKEDDVIGTVIFTGNIGGTYDWTMRVGYVDDASPMNAAGYRKPHSMTNVAYYLLYYARVYNTAMGAITSGPTGTPINIPALSFASYVAGTYTITGTISMGVTYGNFTPAGIVTVVFPVGSNMYQIEFDPAIPKTNIDNLSITFTMDWGRL